MTLDDFLAIWLALTITLGYLLLVGYGVFYCLGSSLGYEAEHGEDYRASR